MFADPQPTPMDLHFRVFRIPVRVQPWFWIISAALGWNLVEIMEPRQRLPYLALWVACVFVSILIHELGHVLVGQWFGSYGHIVLYSFGGLAIGSSDLNRRWQRVAVYAAGPAFQLVLYGLLRLYLRYVLRRHLLWHLNQPALLFALDALLWINLWWAVLNLLPIWPLDGGKIARELFTWLAPVRGVSLSLLLSIAVAGTLAVNELMARNHRPFLPWNNGGDMYLMIFFAIFAVNNWFEMQTLHSHAGWDEGGWS